MLLLPGWENNNDLLWNSHDWKAAGLYGECLPEIPKFAMCDGRIWQTKELQAHNFRWLPLEKQGLKVLILSGSNKLLGLIKIHKLVKNLRL